jgi:hypothetical protein
MATCAGIATVVVVSAAVVVGAAVVVVGAALVVAAADEVGAAVVSGMVVAAVVAVLLLSLPQAASSASETPTARIEIASVRFMRRLRELQEHQRDTQISRLMFGCADYGDRAGCVVNHGSAH